jgi:hypothetical protein
MAASPLRQRGEPESLDDGVDSEVPAAVLCTSCGRGDCPGCSTAEGSWASGVIAIVPWERAQSPWTVRLLDTVQATTRGAEGFFRALPDGSVRPALEFALLTEALAVGSTTLALTPMLLAMKPGLLLRCLSEARFAHAVLGAMLVAMVGFSLLLVAVHALYGLLLGREATRSLALRFGLYACGWDLGTSPAGLFAFAARSGPKAAFGILRTAALAPRRSTEAALAGPLELEGRQADRALTRAMTLTLAVTVPLVAFVLLAMAVTAWIALRG